ncbi:glycosyltransferase family 4 protein [Winogradskyella sp. R77965]|uniref:glycosyltransferase family 4 protein n=1 Tax=Winogradskyella sp. R77965 TaxID=3093872 RepID=UPI0037DD2589
MRVLFIHNNYSNNNSGEEHAAESLANLLEKNGHDVDWYRRSSDIINDSFIMKVMAFFSGFYNFKSVREVKRKIEEFKPDIIQVQNMYPFISPAIIRTIRKKNIPLALRAPNYRLFCPTGLHLDANVNLCEKCLTGVREFNCIKKNCESNFFKSTGYALRGYVARVFWGVTKNFDAYIVQSEFQKKKFITNGIPEHKLFIVSGLTPKISKTTTIPGDNTVSFIGRISREKGIEEFIEAAAQLPKIRFNVIGSVLESYSELRTSSPKNVTWHGFVKGKALDELFKKSKIIVVPSKCYEGFPNVITRAMKHGKPVITSDLGSMASIIDHQENGLLVPPARADLLTEAIESLYNDNRLCKMFGKAAQKKANSLYTEESVYQSLFNVYNTIIH